MEKGPASKPLRLLVDSDYSVKLPIWFLDGPYEIEPGDLSISGELTTALREWSESYASPVLERDSESWPGDEWWVGWIDEGRRLAQRLQAELGQDYQIVYFNEATEEQEQVQPANG
jgi:hypothetical protein